MAMIVRPYRAEDRGTVLEIMRANGEVLSAHGEANYGKYGEECLGRGKNVVIEATGRIIAFCQYHPGSFGPGVAWAPCFVVATDLHGSGRYVRAQLLMEAHIRDDGASRLVASVPPGHEYFRRFLTERRGYVPYHESNGTQFYVKDLKEG